MLWAAPASEHRPQPTPSGEPQLNPWNTFFTGELSAASAFAGLLFVSLSVNQKRVLEIERLADRGLEALLILLLVVVTSSAALVPGQPLRLLGGEISAAGLIIASCIWRLQALYIPVTEERYRRRAIRLVWTNRATVTVITSSGAILLITCDMRSLYVLPGGILLAFVAAGVSAWILLIEINR